MSVEDRLTIYRAELPQPGQGLEVVWIRQADWDAHWAVEFAGIATRQEMRRFASYTEAKTAAVRLAATGVEVTA